MKGFSHQYVEIIGMVEIYAQIKAKPGGKWGHCCFPSLVSDFRRGIACTRTVIKMSQDN